MSKSKETLHCIWTDRRIKHNIRYAQREFFFSYLRHFRVHLNMPLLKSIKKAKAVAGEMLDRGYMPDLVSDSVKGVRYSKKCNTRVCRATRND